MATINVVQDLVPENHNSEAIVHPSRNILDEVGGRNNKEEVRGNDSGEPDCGDQIGSDPKRNEGDTPVPKVTEKELHKKRAIFTMVLVQVQVLDPSGTDVRHGEPEGWKQPDHKKKKKKHATREPTIPSFGFCRCCFGDENTSDRASSEFTKIVVPLGWGK